MKILMTFFANTVVEHISTLAYLLSHTFEISFKRITFLSHALTIELQRCFVSLLSREPCF